jgi:putative ABC transport system permease protein
MKTSRLVKVAVQSIVKNKMRTALTMLGIVIGVGAVIVMVAVGYGARTRIAEQIRNLGTNMIVITPGGSVQAGVSQGASTWSRLTIEDAESLRREAALVSGVSPVVMTRTQAIGGEGNWRTSVHGVSVAYPVIRDWDVGSGTFWTDEDERSGRRVAVVGATVAANLFPGADPVGAQLQLRDSPFTIVGLLERKGQTPDGTDSDDVILVPYTTARSRLSGRSFIGQILATTDSERDLPAAQEEIRSILRESHRLGEAELDDFTIRNQDQLTEAASGTTEVMSMLLAAIASISLLVGGIGIMNIMLVSVTERTREIGIRMAVGARGSAVLTQFLVESIVMSVLGGVLGLLVGLAGAALLGRITGWSTETPPGAVLLAVGFSAAVGVFFGWYPARKAAALDPIQALRYE